MFKNSPSQNIIPHLIKNNSLYYGPRPSSTSKLNANKPNSN